VVRDSDRPAAALRAGVDPCRAQPADRQTSAPLLAARWKALRVASPQMGAREPQPVWPVSGWVGLAWA